MIDNVMQGGKEELYIEEWDEIEKEISTLASSY